MAQDHATDYRLIVRRSTPTEPEGVSIRRPPWPFPRSGFQSRWLSRIDKIGWEQLALPLSSMGVDLTHSLYFTAPLFRAMPTIVTVHDAISLLPEYAHKRTATVYARLMRRTARRASSIITVSNHARNEVAAALDYPIDRIHVTYEAPDPALCRATDLEVRDQLRRKYGLPRSYVLYLGGTERRKNIETLVRAWSGVSSDAVKLVIVGRFSTIPDPLFPDIPGLVSELGLDDRVHLLDGVEEADLAALYSHAIVFCYPSLYEGFGLPPLEAMACGTPVLSSDATSLPEVLGDGAELLPAQDAASWSKALERALDDDPWAVELARRGQAWVKRYSWSRTAEETLFVYSDVLES